MGDISTPQNSDWFWDPYLDWADTLSTNKVSTEDQLDDIYQPVFVRLSDAVAAQIDGGTPIEDVFENNPRLKPFKAKFERHELSYACRIDGVDELYIYLLQSHLKTNIADLLPEFTVLDIGSAVRLNDDTNIEMQNGSDAITSTPGVLVGVIDDGIGFLNERFTKFSTLNDVCVKQTRFEAVWLQSGAKSQQALNSNVRVGKVLNRQDINELLANNVCEFECYQKLNSEILAEHAHRSTEQTFSHGTFVADLAAGFDPHADIPAMNMLGVQLPPESIADTSGARLETHLLMGVRWMLCQASRRQDSIVINVSLGILAGPKNGRGFVEYQIAREIETWEKFTGLRAYIVFAYGNNFLSNQVARYPAVEKDQSRSIDWVTQPDDMTACFAEIRCVERNPAALALPDGFLISVDGPDGTHLAFCELAPGTRKTLYNKLGKMVGRIYHVPGRSLDRDAVTPPYYAISLAPTADYCDTAIKSASGNWKICFKNTNDEVLDVTIQVQRGDTAPGYEPAGRQSYLDDDSAYQWSAHYQDFSGLGDDGPIVHAGSNSALATGMLSFDNLNDSIRSVGSAVRLSTLEGFRPAEYTSQGADWSGDIPSDSVVAEDGVVLQGVMGSGTFSGTVATMSGTSAAAPQVTRWIAMQILNGLPTKVTVSDTHVAVPADYQAQLGFGLLNSSDAVRDRRIEFN